MSNKIAKVVIGFLVITGATAYILPILYPDDGQDPLPLDVRAAYIRSQSAAATHTAAAAKGEQGKDDDDGNLSDTEFAGNEPLGYMDGEEDGYGGLLDENGAPAPADSSGNRVVSGVVVGGDAESSRSGFVNNPTATGSTPAEAARAHKENRERDLALRVERDRQAREQSLLEAQKKAEQDRLKQEAQKKAEQDRLKQEAQKKAEQEKRAAPAKGGDAIPGGRYLQIGVFSTMAQAEAARQRLKNQKIRISKDSSIKPGFGYKIDTVSRPGQYVLLVGPTTGDKVLNEIKPLVGSGSFVVSR